MVQANAINYFSPAKWVVSTVAGEGTHTTIATALTSASSGDTIIIMPGSYTENPTLKAGVNLCAFGSDSSLNNTGNVKIIGKCTFSGAGTVTFFGIELQTNSDFALVVSGSAASIVNLSNCYLNCVNNTGISYTSSSASSSINIFNCNGDIGTTGISIYSMSSTGNLYMNNDTFSNSGASTTVSTNSAGFVFLRYCIFASPFSVTSTGAVSTQYSFFDTSLLNVTSFTFSGGLSTSYNSNYSSGTASSISVTTVGLNLSGGTINSTNTNAVTGAGTVIQNAISYIGTSSQVNTTTATGGAINGLTQGTAPSIGKIGEQIRAFASAVSMSNVTPITITSISLTAGVWDVSANLEIVPSVAATTGFIGISANNNSFTGTVQGDSQLVNVNASTGYGLSISSFRITLASTTTYYLVGEVNFTSGTCAGAGRISGTRVG
jgi:hypothetical protein